MECFWGNSPRLEQGLDIGENMEGAYLTANASGTALGLKSRDKMALRIWGSAFSKIWEKSRQVWRREKRERWSGRDFMMERMSSVGRC